jgi:hypothetical protein
LTNLDPLRGALPDVGTVDVHTGTVE